MANKIRNDGPATHLTKARLEAMLVQRGFGPTLPLHHGPAPAAIAAVELELRPGTLTELVPAAAAPTASAGLTSMAFHLAARAGPQAWIDPRDHFDPASAAAAGVPLDHLLWLRQATVPHALQAALLLLQAGSFRLVVLDLLEQSDADLRLPRSVWFRLLRTLERQRRASLLLLAPRPLAGSCADRVLALRYEAARWQESFSPLFEGARIGAQLLASRRDPLLPAAPPAAMPSQEFVA